MRLSKSLLFVVAAALPLAACQKPKVSVVADFTTNKEVYELNEDVIVTNTSVATNDIIVSCKWEWGSTYQWGKQLDVPVISFDTVGEKEIKLTVVTDSNVSATCTKTITVQDTNKRPVADFSWTPESGISAGDEVQFVDKSTDADGTIVSWEWKIGSSTVTEQNPKFTFAEFGEIEVSLTVTDNQKGTGSVTKVIKVTKSKNSLELVWAKDYDSDAEAYAKFSSPATNADGSAVYVFSSGQHLAAFDPDGNQKWVYDANKFENHLPANARSKDGTKTGSSCTPSVDTDGTIFLAVGYNEDNGNTKTTNESGIYAINPDGTLKWYFPYGNARFVNIIPLILGDRIFLATKSNPTAADYPAIWEGQSIVDNGIMLSKSNGTIAQVLRVKRGSYGGFAATKEETFVVHTDDTYGTRVYWKDGGSWTYYGSNDARDAFMLGRPSSGNPDCGYTTYMAIDSNNRIYILYGKSSSSSSSDAILYCYDLNKYDTSAGASPEWTLDLSGTVNRYYSHGTVVGPDGTVYVTTRKSLTAVNPNGTVKWTVATSADTYSVWGCPAVDDQGYIYFNESEVDNNVQTTGKLVKVSPEGTKVSEVVLGTSVRTSPTISPDGTIYCNGMNDGKVTLFAVRGSATGPAATWSQLGGNSRKSCKAE